MNEIDLSLTFQQKLTEEIKDKIGSLMTDEDLKKIIDRVVNQAFFEERKVGDGYTTRSEPPYFIKLASNLLEANVQAQLKLWFADKKNQAIIKDMIDNLIKKGLANILIHEFQMITSNAFFAFGNQIKNDITMSLSSSNR